jgi:hypothetical protein
MAGFVYNTAGVCVIRLIPPNSDDLSGVVMAKSFELVDKALQGTLAARLTRMRADGWSMDRIAETLRSEGFNVSRETVRHWLKRLKLPSRVSPTETEMAS